MRPETAEQVESLGAKWLDLGIEAAGEGGYARELTEEELQKKIDSLQTRLEKKQRRDLPVLKEVPKVQRRLRKFVQLAMDHGRQDLATSAMAFIAGLDRVLDGVEQPQRRGRASANGDSAGETENGAA